MARLRGRAWQALALVALAAWPVLAPAASCDIEFRTGTNTLDENVWVMFSLSSLWPTMQGPQAPSSLNTLFSRNKLNELDDSRIAPGERLRAVTFRNQPCGNRVWAFYVHVRFGAPIDTPVTKEFVIERSVRVSDSDQDKIVVELGSPACWAAAEEEYIQHSCQTEEESPGEFAPLVTPGGAGCQIEFRSDTNTLDENVWVMFSLSSVWPTMHGAQAPSSLNTVFSRNKLNELDDRRIAPGEQLLDFTFRSQPCGNRTWAFYVHVRFGAPIDTPVTKEFVIERGMRVNDSGQDKIVVDLGSPACWAISEETEIRTPATGCVAEEEDPVDIAGPIRIWNFRSGPLCDAGTAETGRTPSERVCEDEDVPIEGLDTCIFNDQEVRCTWRGFEFDYENGDPSKPISCVWTRDVPINEGNYEGVREWSVTTGTVTIELDGSRGHIFFPGYDVFRPFPHPWLPLNLEYVCSYPGQESLFTARYRLIYSSVFR